MFGVRKKRNQICCDARTPIPDRYGVVGSTNSATEDTANLNARKCNNRLDTSLGFFSFSNILTLDDVLTVGHLPARSGIGEIFKPSDRSFQYGSCRPYPACVPGSEFS